MNKKFTIPGIFCIVLLLAGCSSNPVRVIDAYHGPDLPISKIAVVYTPQDEENKKIKSSALLAGVNGKNYAGYVDGYPTVSKVLPGDVTIKVMCLYGPGGFSRFLIFRTRLSAGHYYELSCEMDGAFAKDRGTDIESVRKLLQQSAKN